MSDQNLMVMKNEPEYYIKMFKSISSNYPSLNSQLYVWEVVKVVMDKFNRLDLITFRINDLRFCAGGFTTGHHNASLGVYLKFNDASRVIRMGKSCEFSQGRPWDIESYSILKVMEKICERTSVRKECIADFFELLMKICWLGQYEGIPNDLRKGLNERDYTFANEMYHIPRDYALTESDRNNVNSYSECEKYILHPFINKIDSWYKRMTKYDMSK